MEKTFTYKNTSVSYECTGKGNPVVLLHGFGEDRDIWNNQVAFLSDYCTLLLPSLPGTGKSGILDKTDVSIDDFADCIYQLLLHENISKAIILGHSMGGYITLALVEKHPEIIEAFGLINSTAFADNEAKKEVRLKGIKLVEEYGSYSFLKNTIPNLFSDNFKRDNGKLVDELIESVKNISPIALTHYYTAMMNRPDRTNVLKDSTVPVLFVVGNDDTAAPLADLQQQVNLPQQKQIHILEEVVHMSMLEATDRLNQAMLVFIKM